MHRALPLLQKSYDLRGIYPSQVDSEFFSLVGQALGSWAGSGVIIVGGDARLSTPELKEALIAGLMTTGRRVIDIWLVSSDMLQFATIHFASECTLGIMVTASHNPKEYNGFKCCFSNARPLDLRKVGPELIHIIESESFLQDIEGSVESYDILPAWIDRISEFITVDLSDLTVVADAGNGVAGAYMTALAEKLGFTLIPLYFEPDGNFPNHHPSPIESKNMIDLQRAVTAHQADIGVAFDGDADRAVLCDSTGHIISPSITMAAIAEYILHTKWAGKILTNTPTSHIVRDTVTRLGGTTLVEKVGNVYLKARMEKDPEIVFAWEHSSHYFFPSLGNIDSGVVAFLVFLEYMGQFELSATEVIQKYSTYSNIEETNYTVESVAAVIECISAVYADGLQDRTDGLTVTYKDWWMSIRGSSNEPLIRLNLEANTPEILELRKTEILKYIK